MGFFIPLVASIGGFVIRKPIISAAGAIIGYRFFDADGTEIGQFTADKLGGAMSELASIGIDVVEDTAESVATGIGEAVPEIIERVGPAVIKGINNTVNALRNELRGSEVKVLTTFMIFIVGYTTAVYLLSWVRGAGEMKGRID